MGVALSARADVLDDAVAAVAADARAGDGLVHCLFPGQVRRLGAFATSVTPRRAARVTQQACADGGGEYIETEDIASATTKIWLPLAADGVPEAQAEVGELYLRQGKSSLARVWLEKAAAQGLARAQFDLAAVLAQEAEGASHPWPQRVAALLTAAGGGAVAGLVYAEQAPLSVAFVAPASAVQLPEPVPGPAVVEAPPGETDVVAQVRAPQGVATVKVNGVSREPDARGFVRVPMTLGAEQAKVVVEAQDAAGRTAQAELVLRPRAMAPAVASRASEASEASGPTPGAAAWSTKGRRLALVVANQHYQHWPALDTPGADAVAVADTLRQHFGFDVTLLQDATRQQLLAALGRLRMQAQPDDQVVIYYAGHGQMDEATARGYWIPVDGDQKDIARWVSVIDVTDQLAAMAARRVLVIADSCYAGTLAHSLIPRIDAALSAAQRQAPLQQLARQRVRVAMTSGGLEPVVDGGSVGHSLFARSLLDMLAQVRSPVTAQELFAAVSARFAHLAGRLQIEQHPQYAPIGFAGHEAGDFVLVPRTL